MYLKLFWKEGCKKCEQAKEICRMSGLEVAEFNVDTVEGLAEACYHQVSLTPAIVLVDDNDKELKVWRSILEAKKELS
ncbi:MAG: glutaredoxin domain-containing protein, partial [Candidatus Thermoplasmatota archaeon]